MITPRHLTGFALLAVLAVSSPQAQTPPARPPAGASAVLSPEINPDRSVTFRLHAPNAKKVVV